ncbi:MAG: class I SAM-dependent methyltransferase [Asgard group archaeon]|nr:class I SAM-dependent methyltransferase [Asgard group archaeon]
MYIFGSSKLPKNKFMSKEEYANSFTRFFALRKKIARSLISFGLSSGMNILDILAGHGFFSYEIAKLIKKGKITAIGLQNDLDSFNSFSKKLIDEQQRKAIELINYELMDIINLEFPDNTFDFVVNFLGLEDVNMTRGPEGVKQALRECARVLKPSGILQITLCLEGDEPDQIIAKEVTDLIGHQAIFYPKEFYIEELEKSSIEIIDERWFYSKRKMTAEQAKEELVFACNETPKYFKEYDIKTISFEELWKKYGEKIEKHGMAFYSQLLILIGRKIIK